jgi:VCBS repeat-containing protein
VITVVGANDAPTIDLTVGVEHGQVTEEGVTVAGDADDTGTVTASDPDDTPSFVSEGESGTYGSFAIDAGGTWTYTLNNTDIETDALDAGDTSFDLFTITAIDDDNATATSVVTITVHGANDAPSVSVGDGTVTEAGSTLSGVPTATGTALETDPDDPPAAEPVFGGTTSGTYGSFSISTLGAWTYSLDNGDTDTDALTAGQTAFDTYTITATDDDSATGTDVVTITVIGEEEGVAIGSGGLTDTVVESGSISTGPIAGDSLAAGDVNASGGDGGYVFSFGGSATYGTFSGDTTTGEWTYTLNQSATNVQQLDTGDTATEVFTVTVDDQAGGTATANITVTVIGTNDAPTITGDVLSGTVTELGISFTGSDPDNPTLITVGTMTASGDVDTTDFDDTVAIFSGDATGSYGVFDIDSTTGQWTYTLNAVYSDTHEESEFPNLTSGQTEFETFTVTAVDDNGAIDTDVVVITVHGQDEFCILDLRQTSGGGSETLTLYGDQPSFTTEPFSPGDTPCANIMVGENGYEIFYGDERSDTLFGGEQDDTLYGGIDNDRLFGGSNDDVAVGNAGDDRIFGGNNDDMIYGDVLFAGPGADPASPGSVGNDVLYGGNGVDIIFGDNGLDDAFGGNDEIFGEDGGDTLRGEGGDDVIFGGVLGDEIWGGFGEDTIYGGAGADDFNYRSIGGGRGHHLQLRRWW